MHELAIIFGQKGQMISEISLIVRRKLVAWKSGVHFIPTQDLMLQSILSGREQGIGVAVVATAEVWMGRFNAFGVAQQDLQARCDDGETLQRDVPSHQSSLALCAMGRQRAEAAIVMEWGCKQICWGY